MTCPSPATPTGVEITATYLGVVKKYSVTVKPLLLPDLTVSAILYDSGNNVITRPTNPQPFRIDPGSTYLPCRMIEGLEIGEYVDFTLTADPANATPESNEANNTQQFRVTR